MTRTPYFQRKTVVLSVRLHLLPVGLTLAGLVLCVGVYAVLPAPVGLDGVFLDSWQAYLRSVPTSRQMQAYQAFLVYCALTAFLYSLVSVRMAKCDAEFANRKAGSTAWPWLALGGMALACVLVDVAGLRVSWLWTSLRFWGNYLVVNVIVGGLFSALAYGWSHRTGTARGIRCVAGAATAYAVLLFLVAGWVYYPPRWNSYFLSWHYGAYFGDALRLAVGQGFDRTEGVYGIALQFAVGMIQRYGRMWSLCEYVGFLKAGQTLFLLVIIAWLYAGYRRRRHWIVLLVGLWFTFVYSGASVSINTGTQGSLRRAGLILFLMSLPWFGVRAKRGGPWIPLLHGICVGLLGTISIEWGIFVGLTGLVFWGTALPGVRLVGCLRLMGFFLAGCLVAAFALLSVMGLVACGKPCFPSAQLLRPFSSSITHRGFGGLPLRLVGLVLIAFLFACYVFFDSLRGWWSRGVRPRQRMYLACCVLFFVTFVYYLQRNAGSSLHTPLIPLVFLSLYIARGSGRCLSGGGRRIRGEYALAILFLFFLTTAHLKPFAEESAAHHRMLRSHIAASESYRAPEEKKLAELADAMQTACGRPRFLLVSPVQFQLLLAMKGHNIANLDVGVFDPMLLIDRDAQHKYMADAAGSSVECVVFDLYHFLHVTQPDSFERMRFGELKAAFEGAGYQPVEDADIGTDILVLKRQAQER